MIMVALILLGVVALPLLPVSLYPNLQIPVAIVTVPWPGVMPAVVEQQVTKPVEAAMSTVANVSEVDSISSYGSSTVIVRFNYGTDMNTGEADMRDKMNQVMASLPSTAGVPEIRQIDPNSMPIMTFALAARNGNIEQLTELANDEIIPRLEEVGGVASVSLSGARTRQIQVVVDPARLANYGLSITSVVQALQADNLQGDAGLVDKGTQQVDINVNGQFATPGDVMNVPIRLPSGAAIKVSDVAAVRDTYADVTQEAFVNGLPCVRLDIYMVSGGNTVQTSDNVRKALPAVDRLLPAGDSLTMVIDQAQYIRDSIDTLVEHTLLGAGFALIVLWLFLRRVRTTMVVAIGIPIAVISTFALLYFTGQTINTITLGGLTLGMGSLVDFAIVVIESIFRQREGGLGPVEAAKAGTAEVGTAVLASALAQISVFAPIAFTQGLASQLFLPMALAVVFSHVAALVGALTLVPMLAARLMRGRSYRLSFAEEAAEQAGRRRAGGPATRVGAWARSIPVWFSLAVENLKERYRTLLRWSLSHRKVVVLATLALLAVSVLLLPVIGFELTPNTDEGQYTVSITLDQGTVLPVTAQVVDEVVSDIRRMPETQTVFTTVGSGGGTFISVANGTNTASIDVILKPLSQRKKSVFQVIEELRREVASIPGARITMQATQQTFGRGGLPIQVVLQGNDLTVLTRLGDLVGAEMSRIPGIRDVQSNQSQVNQQYDVNVNRALASQYGISVSQVLTTLQDDFGNGVTATNYIAGSASVPVVVKLPESYTLNYANLGDIDITSPSGAQIPLSDLATVTASSSPVTIRRQDQMDEVTIEADVFGRSQGQVQDDVEAMMNRLALPAGYTWSMGGQATDMASSFAALGMAMPLAIVLMYMVMAGQFESLLYPFIIMFSLPPTFVGVVLGMLLTGHSFSIEALMGVIMLIGIVTNNAIVLVDYANQLRRRGLATREALLQAGPVRLRPILMTTAVTVLAMLPVMIGGGEGSETMAPMATVVVFGLTVSTLVTLVLIPVMYTILDDFGVRLRKRWEKPAETGPAVPLSD